MAHTISISGIKQHLRASSCIRWIIYINLAVYVLLHAAQFLLDSLGLGALELLRLGALYPSSYRFLSQPWGLLTYSWLHDGLLHLLPNMYFLYIIDRTMTQDWAQTRLVALYLLSSIGGGIFLVLGYLLASALGGYFVTLPVYGSSGAIFALLAAIAMTHPYQEYESLLLGRIRMYGLLLAIILVDITLMFLFGDNMGGHILHYIGLLFGAGYAFLLRRYDFDLLAPLLALWELIRRRYRARPLPPIPAKLQPSPAELHRVLEKVRSSGYAALSEHERSILTRDAQDTPNS